MAVHTNPLSVIENWRNYGNEQAEFTDSLFIGEKATRIVIAFACLQQIFERSLTEQLATTIAPSHHLDYGGWMTIYTFHIRIIIAIMAPPF